MDEQLPNNDLPYRILTLTSPNKPTDRNILSRLTPLTFRGHQVGLFCLVEVTSPWNPARQAAEQIIDSLQIEFSRGEGNSLLMRFEQALKTTNNLLEKFEEKIGQSLNVATIVLNNQEVHFSSTGQIGVMLGRDGKINDVSGRADLTESRFSAVTSGDLTKKDTLAVVTSSLAKALPSASPENFCADPEVVLKDLRQEQPEADLSTWRGIVVKYAPDSPLSSQFTWDETERSLELPKVKMPAFELSSIGLIGQKALANLKAFFARIKLPKISLERARSFPYVKFLLNNILYSGVAIVVVAGLAVYLVRGRVIKHLNTNTSTPNLVDQLSDQNSNDIYAFLNQSTTFAAYENLTEAQKQDFQNKLESFQVSALTLPSVMSELSQPVSQMAAVGSNLYLLDSTGQLTRWDGHLLAQIDQTQKIASPTGLVAFADNKIVATDAAGGLWLFDSSSDSPKSLASPASLPVGRKIIAKYQNNLYIQTANGAVYKVANFSDNLNSASLATKAGVCPFTTATKLVVPGDFYAVSSGGKVVTWKKSVLGTLTFTLPVTSAPSGYVIDAGGNHYLASGNFLFVYNNAGVLQKSYFLPANKPIGALEMTAGGLAVAIDTNLYLVNL
ncbi:MAG TPA: hypothetical protein VMQ44_03805 [Candidatus Saccharimonadales bacterium]|nr:hypothetical protein [Candidatus Saccharimonadales bacterium]